MMPDETQHDVIEFLTAALEVDGSPPKIITTHISMVFLNGSRAFKLKRAVAFPFLDFTLLKARHDACVREVAINQRTAPAIYIGVVPVTHMGGSFEINGNGEVVDWLVEMTRFDEETIFDRLAGKERGLRRPMIEDLADTISAFHSTAEIRQTKGGAAGIRMIAMNNVQAFHKQAETGIFDAALVHKITSETLERINQYSDELDSRRDAGRVRACHGDMHLRNICLIDDKPTLFDAIEFSDDFSDIDVLYDFAFLLMDLEYHDKRRLAAFLLNRYFDVGDETAEAYQVLPIFLAMRAQIRAHVSAAIAGSQSDQTLATKEADAARRYLELAGTYMQVVPPRLVAVGGLSGSGKSRLAREIASYIGYAPGARVIRTDVVRKRLFGIHPNDTLGADGYTPEATEKTYEAFLDQARATLSAGQSVILDAVFAKSGQRQLAQSLAEKCGVPFTGLWVDAPEQVRVERVGSRKHNVSDVTTDIARAQSDYELGHISWFKVDSSGKKNATIAQALKLLGV